MSEINSSNQSLTKILDKLGINSSKEKFAPKETKDQLGQEDFLKLMTTQLQNQDPFAPCLLYTSPSPRDRSLSRMPSSA